MDRLYTAIPTAKWLLQKNITMIGTMQQNRKGIPPEVKRNERKRSQIAR